MPNWCMNSATITGNKETLDKIEKACEEEKLLEFLAPLGEWEYSKALETWGTKWEAHEISYDLQDDSCIVINFDSAWGPPLDAYNNGEKNHNIKIEASFYEPGMGYVGDREKIYAVDFEEQDWWNFIPDELVDDWGLVEEYEIWKEW